MAQTPKSEVPLTFTFTESEGKLHIKAQAQSVLYACDIDAHPTVDFTELKEVLVGQFFKVVTITNETLKLKVGFLNIEMKCHESLIIAEMRWYIKKVEDQIREELRTEAKKNSEMEQVIRQQEKFIKEQQNIIKEQENKINSLTTGFSELTERLSQIEQINRQSKQSIRMLETINLIKNNIFSIKQFAAKSLIVKTNQEMETIKQFFYPQKVSHIQMLYRASQNAFSAYEFHAKCNYIPDTLTLGETEFGKKIGGYTPLVWSSAGANRSDPSGKSFIFSLTNRDKFVMNQYQNAIRDHASYGPTFGNGDDLHIYDNANTGNSSYSQINTAYHNNKYTKGDGNSWQRFNGNPAGSNGGQNFKLREWEVWRVIFEETEQAENN